jgi:hypothetical protein
MKTDSAPLGGEGRRPRKEGRTPRSNDRAHLDHWRGRSNLHQDNDRRSDGHRGHGVHDDAQRAMVRITFQGMNVGDLDNRNQCQQEEAHDRCYRERSWSSGRRSSPSSRRPALSRPP